MTVVLREMTPLLRAEPLPDTTLFFSVMPSAEAATFKASPAPLLILTPSITGWPAVTMMPAITDSTSRWDASVPVEPTLAPIKFRLVPISMGAVSNVPGSTLMVELSSATFTALCTDMPGKTIICWVIMLYDTRVSISAPNAAAILRTSSSCTRMHPVRSSPGASKTWLNPSAFMLIGNPVPIPTGAITGSI